MNVPLNIFSYRSYRSFLRDLLKAKGYSYRSFAESYSQIISFIALAKTLSQGRGKMLKKPSYNMSAETLARLGSALRLSEEELQYLILLKLENDAERYKGAYGDAFRRIIQSLLNKQEKKAITQVPSSSMQLLELFECLPSRYQEKILLDTILQGKVYLGRQRGKPGVKKVERILENLKKHQKAN